MNRKEKEILEDLKYDWTIQSITAHQEGYWDFEDASFDLKDLKGIKELNGMDSGQFYFFMTDHQAFLCIAGDESYYHVERINKGELKLACYFRNQVMDSHIKLATFELRRNERRTTLWLTFHRTKQN